MTRGPDGVGQLPQWADFYIVTSAQPCQVPHPSRLDVEFWKSPILQQINLKGSLSGFRNLVLDAMPWVPDSLMVGIFLTEITLGGVSLFWHLNKTY